MSNVPKISLVNYNFAKIYFGEIQSCLHNKILNIISSSSKLSITILKFQISFFVEGNIF